MKKITIIIMSVVLLALCTCSCLANEQHPVRLVDEAGLLTETDYNSLLQKLDNVSEKHDFDVVIVTVNGIDSKNSENYAYDYFVDNGYGIDGNGIILLISMEKRDYAFVPSDGYGETVFNDDGLEFVDKKTIPYISDGEYYNGFTVFAEQCDDFLIQAENGTPYVKSTLPEEPFSVVFNVVVCLAIGLVVGFISVSVMKSGMKSVKMQNSAACYVVDNSMKVTESKDTFLYRNVTRIKKPDPPSSNSSHGHHGGGSSSSHGGRSGKF